MFQAMWGSRNTQNLDHTELFSASSSSSSHNHHHHHHHPHPHPHPHPGYVYSYYYYCYYYCIIHISADLASLPQVPCTTRDHTLAPGPGKDVQGLLPLRSFATSLGLAPGSHSGLNQSRMEIQLNMTAYIYIYTYIYIHIYIYVYIYCIYTDIYIYI